MAKTTIPGGYIEAGSIDTASLADTSITANKLHTTLDLTGKSVTVATATAGDNDTTVASTAFVSTAITNLAPLASPTFTGTLTASGLAYPTSDGTNGQVLTTDGAGTLSFSTVSGTTINNNADNRIITGSGTANTLNGESGLTYDGSTLAVTGTLNIDSNGGVDNYYLRFKESGADRFTMYENSNNVYLNGGPGNTIFRPRQNGGTGNFAVTGSNVGIGTSSPATKLNVSDSSGNAYKALTVQSSNVNSDVGISLIGGGGSDFRLQQPYNSAGLFFYDVTNTAERMRIGSSGNVGIGTSSPNQDGFGSTSRVLTVKAPSSGGTGALELIGLANSSGDLMSAINFMSYAVTNPAARITALRHTADDEASITFDTSGAERLRIDQTGKVGIGTTSPSAKLHVSGDSVANTFKLIANTSVSGSDATIFRPADNTMAFSTNGAERMRIDSAGKVGIGTTNPSDNHLSISFEDSTTYSGTSAQTGNGIFVNNRHYTTTEAFSQIRLGVSGNSGASFARLVAIEPAQAVSDFAICLRNGSTYFERFRLQGATGETTITGTKMNVISSAEAVMGAQATGNSYWRVVADNSPNTYFQAGTGQSSSQVKMYFTGMYGSNNTMTVDTPNSRVGIGTTSPGKKLDVRGTIRATAVQNDISLSDELPGYGANSYGNLKASTNNIYLAIGNSYIGYINSSAQLNASDARLKENVATLTGALDKVNQLRGVSFNWIDSARGEGTHIGFIAQELEAVYPELVGDGGLPDDDDGQSAIKSVDYGHMVPVLVEAIKELKAENDALRARLDAGGL